MEGKTASLITAQPEAIMDIPSSLIARMCIVNSMRRIISRLIGWLLRLRNRRDLLVEEYLQRNRDALEKQRQEFAKAA